MPFAQQVEGVGEPTLELVADQPVEGFWGIGLLVVLVVAAFALPWLARRGWVLPGAADDADRRRGGRHEMAITAAVVLAGALLARAFGVSLSALWASANTHLDAPITILLVAVGAFRLGQLNPRRSPEHAARSSRAGTDEPDLHR